MQPREIKHYDLSRVTPMVTAQIDFTRRDDQRWAGIIELSPHEKLPLESDARNDMFVLSGQLSDDEASYSQDTFLSVAATAHNGNVRRWRAGADGAVLFSYRDRSATVSGNEVLSPAQLDWLPGGADGMQVATLSVTSHRLMLVSWQPSTRMRFHRHPQGEEIFVLKGRLIDEHGSYCAGSWQRLYADAGHAPYAEETSLILLRNGHLQS